MRWVAQRQQARAIQTYDGGGKQKKLLIRGNSVLSRYMMSLHAFARKRMLTAVGREKGKYKKERKKKTCSSKATCFISGARGYSSLHLLFSRTNRVD